MAQGMWRELIQKRNSCRSFDGRSLSSETLEALEQAFLRCQPNPFGAAVRLPILDAVKLVGKQLGTYGVIRGASAYFAGVVKSGDRDREGLGWSMERAVLEAAALGVGTCWLAGTYRRADFSHAVPLASDEKIICVSPIGLPAVRRTLLDSLMRGTIGSARRKPWASLFYEGSFDTPLSEEDAGEWRNALEAVRLAPSASNGQPWRVVRQGRAFHFYRNTGYGDITRVDMGIAACHFELVAKELGLPGGWIYEDPGIGRSTHSVYAFTWSQPID